MRFVKRRKDRDMERLALLEQLAAPASSRPAAGTHEGRTDQIARYARFRHVGAFILVLALCTAAVGLTAAVIEATGLLRGDAERLRGLVRVLAWLFATLTAYGLLKCAGEALLLLADTAELANSIHERTAATRAEPPR